MTTIPPIEASHIPGATPIENPLVSVLIPVFNEELTLDQVVRRVAQLDVRMEILIVDDGSRDGSLPIAEALAAEFGSGRTTVRSLPQPENLGKGAAVRAGIAASKGDIVLIQDADLEYDPADLPALLEPLITGHANVVYGSRFSGGRPQRAHLFAHYLGNKFLTALTRALFNTTLSDMEVGYKAFRGELVRSLHLTSNDFRIEPELTARVLQRPGIRLYEAPISYFGRSFDEGKKITWRDGYRALSALIRFRFDRDLTGPEPPRAGPPRAIACPPLRRDERAAGLVGRVRAAEQEVVRSALGDDDVVVTRHVVADEECVVAGHVHMNQPVSLRLAQFAGCRDRAPVEVRSLPRTRALRLHQRHERVQMRVDLDHDHSRAEALDRLPDPVVVAVDVDREHIELRRNREVDEETLDVRRVDQRVAGAHAPRRRVFAVQLMVLGRVAFEEHAGPPECVGEQPTIGLHTILSAELDEEPRGRDAGTPQDLTDHTILPVLGEDPQLVGAEPRAFRPRQPPDASARVLRQRK